MKKLVENKLVGRMTLLCSTAYFASYITRTNFGAVILEIIQKEGITKSAASIIITGSFITYGMGQLVSGYLGDKIKPNILVLGGLIVASIMNFLIPFCNNTQSMIAVWCVNGFAQAMIWPPMVKIMTNMFADQDYKRSCVKVAWGGSFGTIAIYLFAPIFIAAAGWKSVFTASAVLGFLVSFVWMFSYRRIERYTVIQQARDDYQAEPPNKRAKLTLTPRFILTFTLIMLAIVLQGILRDGITTWMPSYLSETYNLSSKISILTGVGLPVFSIISLQVVSWLYGKVFTNELACSTWIYGIGLFASALLFFFSSYNVALSVILSTVITGCMHGINLMLVCFVPSRFEKYGRASSISGILNFCTYVGSSVSTFGIAVLAENFGWSLTIGGWVIIAFSGAIVCFINTKNWNSFCAGNSDILKKD